MKTFHSSCITVSLLAALALFAPASSRADDLTHSDKSFLKNAYEDGLAEVNMGEMALRKTASADVKAFAERIATDHNAANKEMKSLADSKKVTLATDITTMAAAKAKLLDAKTGADFDKAFASAAVSDHKKAIKAF